MDSGEARSSSAQLKATAKLWPDFLGRQLGDGTLVWRGPLCPKAKRCMVFLYWKPGVMSLPFVMLDEPALEPRPGGQFSEIPHLMFDAKTPTESGLCLFDPVGRESSPARLIAETTIPWTAEWLAYYEIWHMTGDWLAPSVGYESVARMQQTEAEIIREIRADVH